MPKHIQPYTIYDLEEAADILGVDRKTMYKKVKTGELQSKIIGKGHKFLGENLLRFMGSPTISQMKPNISSDSLKK